MSRAFAVLMLAAVAAGQRPLAVRVVGTVESIATRELKVNSSGITKTIRLAQAPPAFLKTGREFSFHCEEGASGQLTAINIGKPIIFSAEVLHGGLRSIEVQHGEKTRRVYLIAENTLGFGKLEVGAQVRIEGWEMGAGEIDAARVVVLNTDIPVRLPRQFR